MLWPRPQQTPLLVQDICSWQKTKYTGIYTYISIYLITKTTPTTVGMDANYDVCVNELINNNHIISHNIFNNIKCTVCFVKVSLVNKHNQCLKTFYSIPKILFNIQWYNKA